MKLVEDFLTLSIFAVVRAIPQTRTWVSAATAVIFYCQCFAQKTSLSENVSIQRFASLVNGKSHCRNSTVTDV